MRSRAELEDEVHRLMVKCGGFSQLLGVIVTSLRHRATKIDDQKRKKEYFQAANGVVDCVNHMDRLKI